MGSVASIMQLSSIFVVKLRIIFYRVLILMNFSGYQFTPQIEARVRRKKRAE